MYRLLISIEIIKRWSDGGMGVDFRMLTILWEFFRNDGMSVTLDWKKWSI